MAWSKNGTTTLSSAGDNVTVSSLTASDFNMFISHRPVSGATATSRTDVTFNSDSGTKYATRDSWNGSTDHTHTSDTKFFFHDGGKPDKFNVMYVCSISGEEKLIIGFGTDINATGAGNAPDRAEAVGKYVPSPDADITSININIGNGAGDWAIGSNLTALNGDTTEVAVLPDNLQSGSRFEATDTRKFYYYHPPSFTPSDYTMNFRFDNNNFYDSSSNAYNQSVTGATYSSSGGGSDGTLSYVDPSAITDWSGTYGSYASGTNQTVMAWAYYDHTTASNHYYHGWGNYNGWNGYSGNKWFRQSPMTCRYGQSQVLGGRGVNLIHSNPYSITTNAWHHFATVHVGSTGKAYGYIDGVLKTSSSGETCMVTSDWVSTRGGWTYNNSNGFNASEWYKMSDLRLYEYALTQTEIQNAMESTSLPSWKEEG